MNALPTSTPFSRLLVGFASESGNARALAQRLGAELQPHGPQVLPVSYTHLTLPTILLV